MNMYIVCGVNTNTGKRWFVDNAARDGDDVYYHIDRARDRVDILTEAQSDPHVKYSVYQYVPSKNEVKHDT